MQGGTFATLASNRVVFALVPSYIDFLQQRNHIVRAILNELCTRSSITIFVRQHSLPSTSKGSTDVLECDQWFDVLGRELYRTMFSLSLPS